MTKEQKEWIDNASYEDLLRRWRNAFIGDAMFQDETGDYYSARLKELRAEVGPAEHTAASKRIGWEGR